MTWNQAANISPLDWSIADTMTWFFILVFMAPVLVALIVNWIAMIICFAKDALHSFL